MNKLVLASNNSGKLQEIKAYLSPLGIEVLSQQQFGVTAVAETGKTFVENALIKARHACDFTDLPILADDSGLSVDALGGEPGLYSARFAGEDASDEANIAKLLAKLVGKEPRDAKFYCALVVLQNANDPCPIIATGTWLGKIASDRRGDSGFGYDPIFIPNGLAISAAQLSAKEKGAISHRAVALKVLVKAMT